MNARERAQRRATAQSAPIVQDTAPRAPLPTASDKARLFGWLVQRRMAQIGMAACAVAAIAGAIAQGLPGFLAGLLGVYVFHGALPRADEDLDKLTGRKANE